MRKGTSLIMGLVMAVGSMQAADHVMQATHHVERGEAPAEISLTLEQAQNYAVQQNRSLRNANLAVQEAYAQRWQTIASMLPQADATGSYTNMCNYQLNMMGATIAMPPYGEFDVKSSAGVSAQGIIGALMQTQAIALKKVQYEQNELELRGNVYESYASVLTLESIEGLLDSSLVNLQRLEQMTQRSVDVGMAEQTTADLIHVRVNNLQNNIEAQKRNITLARASLKVLLDVPVETKLVLTDGLENLLSAETVLNLLGENFDIRRNQNYRLLEKNTEIARLGVHNAAWAYGPTVAAYHQYSSKKYYSDAMTLNMTPPNTVGVSVSMPLWSSGKRAAGVVEKKIAYEEARNTLEETKDQLYIQNEQLRSNLQTAYATYLNEKDNLSVTKRVFNSTTQKFTYGTTSNLDLTNASNDLISAQTSYVQAVLSLVNAQVALTTFLNNK